MYITYRKDFMLQAIYSEHGSGTIYFFCQKAKVKNLYSSLELFRDPRHAIIFIAT